VKDLFRCNFNEIDFRDESFLSADYRWNLRIRMEGGSVSETASGYNLIISGFVVVS